ncbi:MAG: chemotaxis protein CheD [Candidatus Heimdallarchaeota archaeon]|nr:chemotaxis protein CheD [Candidatus Heimdallarchaeota archaeon]
MDSQEIHVGIADLKVGKAPAILSSLGIGSCVGITMYDSRDKIGGMAHIMLPDQNLVKNKTNRAKFANTAIPDMLDELLKLGAEKVSIKAKIMGGAHMFKFVRTSAISDIGKRNVEEVKKVLKELKIRILEEDTGGDYGRSLFFDLSNGEVKIRTTKNGVKVL